MDHSVAPMQTSEFEALDETNVNRPLTVLPVFSGEAFLRLVPYPVIVEGWHRRLEGRAKRAYQAEFTKAEQRVLECWHARFARWHLRSGTPRRVACRVTSLTLLKRATEFFADPLWYPAPYPPVGAR